MIGQREKVVPSHRVDVKQMTPGSLPNQLVVYHGYVLTNNFKLSFPVIDTPAIISLKHYLTEVGIFWPWHAKEIIDYCRENSPLEIKKECKRLFPEMFSWGSGPSPMGVPESLKDWNTLDISVLEREVKEYKQLQAETYKEQIMEENTNTQTEQTNNGPQVTNYLTLANYKENTGKRFRLTKAEKALVEAGETTREEVFNRRRDNGLLEL